MSKTTWRLLGCRALGTGWQYDESLAQSDLAAVKIIHEAQIARYGKDVVGDFPDPLKPPVIVSMVAERDGVIVDGAVCEAIIETCLLGTDSRAAAALRRFAPTVIGILKARGFRLCRTFVPRVVAEPVGKELIRTGFKEQSDLYTHYLLDLR